MRCTDTAAVSCSRSRDGREMEKGSGKKRRRSAYFVHVTGRPHGSGVDFLAKQRLGLDARNHEEHANRVVEIVIDRTAPDDPRLRVDLLTDELRSPLGLGHGQVPSADDANERAARVREVHLAEQW